MIKIKNFSIKITGTEFFLEWCPMGKLCTVCLLEHCPLYQTKESAKQALDCFKRTCTFLNGPQGFPASKFYGHKVKDFKYKIVPISVTREELFK